VPETGLMAQANVQFASTANLVVLDSAAMSTPLPSPGWYPDPTGAPGQKYWDGHAWHMAVPSAGPVTTSKGKPWLWVLLVPVLFFGGCAALIAIGSSSNSSDVPGAQPANPSPARTAAPASPAPATPTVAPPGSAVRDGKFEFRVLSVSSAKTVSDPTGNRYMTATAQGVFVIFTLSVRNIGDEPRSYSGRNQKLIDMSGREYEVSSDADLYMNSYGLVDDINPGNAIEVKVPFDVPPDTKMSMLELHDSIFSAGVRVAAAAAP
jgi:hypothetical protein